MKARTSVVFAFIVGLTLLVALLPSQAASTRTPGSPPHGPIAGVVNQQPHDVPLPMPPYPGLIERLKREDQPLPPFVTDPDFFRSRGINQVSRKTFPPTDLEQRRRRRLPPVPGIDEKEWPRAIPGPQIQPSGNFNALALLVHFSDNASSVAPSFFDPLIFGATGNSVRVYCQEVSYGTLTIVTVDLPSATGWNMAPQTYAYYVNGNYGWGSYPQNAQRLTEDVVNLADPYVDFSQYDNDSDSLVDALFIVHAGPGAEFTGNPNDIWSHQWSTYNPPFVDGVYVTSYSMEPEYWSSPGDMTIGVYAHELGHVFGLPDLYDYGYDSAGVGDWSLMAYGSWNGPLGSSPAHFDAWCRAQLGFVTPVTVVGDTTNVIINSVETTSTNSVYYVWDGGAVNNEYFLVENRQQTGYDAYLPSNGLLIWHVDDNMSSNDNQCTDHQNCNCTLHYQVALEQADGNLDLEYDNNSGDGGDPYPGTSNNRTFDLGSTPNCGSYADCTSAVEVFNISNSGSTMTADITVGVSTNTSPTLSGLPIQIVDQTTILPVTIDLWAYASDAETPDSGLSYTIEGAPPTGAGVTIVGNQWLTINPSTSWCGYTDVTIRVTDPGGLWDEDTFRVAVTWSCQG